jgi:hypothetical protein
MACVIVALVTWPAIAADAASSGFHSGIYEGLLLAAAPDGTIQGSYREQQGEGVTKTCSFRLIGHQDGNLAITIETWNTTRFPGTLAPTNDGVKLAVPKGREHPGCGLVLLPSIASGIDLSAIRRTAWVQLEEITHQRAVLYSTPAEQKGRHPYLVKGDVVGLLDRKEGWLHVEYMNANLGSTIGWIHANEAEPLHPPEAGIVR